MLFFVEKQRPLLLGLFLFQYFVKIESIKVIGPDTSVRFGENGVFFSQLIDTEESLSRIIWRKKTREDPVEKSFFIILPDGRTENINGLKDRIKFIGNIAEKIGSVQLLGMRLLDEGIYTCIFNLFPSGPFEVNINVTVLVPPKGSVEGAPPVSGDVNVTLASCFATNARPAAKVLWRLGPLQSSLRIETSHTMHSNGTFTVVSNLVGSAIKQFNQQKVQCVVTHEALDKELVLDYSINVHYPPESVLIIPDKPIEPKEFQCMVDCNPEPTNYTWSRVNKTTPQHEGYKLLVAKLTPDFNGLYICTASNQYGSSSGSLYIHVHSESSSVCRVLLIIIIILIICAVVLLGVYAYRRKMKSNSQNQNQRVVLLPARACATDAAAASACASDAAEARAWASDAAEARACASDTAEARAGASDPAEAVCQIKNSFPCISI
ncbi:nectin-2 [Misgurnus anguillicaudatus]|uniref:nectin-2 n=1 Tax=Misgurnus anguillicaudatus TaxID=75329 RepID=UPI003CCFA4E8